MDSAGLIRTLLVPVGLKIIVLLVYNMQLGWTQKDLYGLRWTLLNSVKTRLDSARLG